LFLLSFKTFFTQKVSMDFKENQIHEREEIQKIVKNKEVKREFAFPLFKN